MQENYQAIIDQLRKYDEGAAPLYLSAQKEELETGMNSLRANLESLVQ